MVLDFNLSDQMLATEDRLGWWAAPTYLSPQHRAAMRSGARVDAQADVCSLDDPLSDVVWRTAVPDSSVVLHGTASDD